MAAHTTQPRSTPQAARLTPFLGRLRQRLQRRDLSRGLLLWLTGTLGSSALLMALAATVGPSVVWPPLLTAWTVAVLSSGGFYFYRAYTDPPTDEFIARYVADRVPDLASDLISAVQLSQAPPTGSSQALIAELCQRTAAATATLDTRQLVSFRPVVKAGLLFALVLSLFTIRFGLLWQGAKILVQLPPPHPVQVSSEPLVGDLRLLLTYPRYSGLPPRTLPGSSGDVLVLPGTEIRIEARVLVPALRAQAVLQTGKSEQTLPVQIVHPEQNPGAPRYPLLVVSFTVQQPGSYYFLIDRAYHDSVRERDPHRIDIETDQPPRIDLFAPADELEVTGTRRIELGYSAEDDLGLGDIDLVYKIGGTGERRKRVRSADDPQKPGATRTAPTRSVAAKIEWDLSELELATGVAVVYHMEARDLDNISGPNVGRSRDYLLRIMSPREKSDALLAGQEQLRELSIHLLGDRLELNRALSPTGAAVDGRDLSSELWERFLTVHRKAEALLLHIGRVQQDSARGGSAPKDLYPTLQEIGRRLGRLTQDEETLLAELRTRRTQAANGRRSGSGGGKEIAALNDRHVGELERDTLLLDDLIGRQRLEDLLEIGDEMTALRDRMKQLLADYKKAPSEALRRELERELRTFERRLAELMERAQRLSREVPDEFLNREALGQNDMQSRLDRMRQMLEKGDIDKVAAEFERMSQALDGLMKGMESDLRGYRRERFTAEERALAEMESRLSDLAHDEEDIKRRTEELKSMASARARQLVRDRAESLSRRLLNDVARLRKLLGDVDVAPLGPWGSDEMDKVTHRLEDLGKMLEQGDLDEARAMAQQAEQSLGKLEDELRSEEQASRWGQRVRLGRSRARLEQGREAAREIESEITRALPRPEELLAPPERRQLSDLRAEQEALRRRGGELGKEFSRRAQQTKDAPLLERLGQQASEVLRRAGGFMQQSEEDLRRLSPRSAAASQGQALEQLHQMQKQVQQARRPQNDGAGTRAEREPVKIPGAEEYRAPKEFRQDILDAAKREPPPEYREQVKHYYEELIQ